LKSQLLLSGQGNTLTGSPGVIVIDDPSKLAYPMPLDAADDDAVFVGRIRPDHSVAHGLNLWVVSDNIRKGAATNSIQIAELLIKIKVSTAVF
jgi:aspartate-semialdehyde dehydrogenase